MYTIGQVSEMTGLPISTLRYYDKEGLFPHMERVSGMRRFGEQELETLHVIECLKASGLEIRDIRQFMQWCTEGASSYPKRWQLLERQKETLEAQMDDLRRSLAMPCCSSSAGITSRPCGTAGKSTFTPCCRTSFRRRFRCCTTYPTAAHRERRSGT